MRKIAAFMIMMVAVVCVAATGCSRRSRNDSITIIGSDTMVNLLQSWAEEFMKIHPDYSLAVTGGGSGTGIASLISSTCDVAASSRKMKPREIEIAHQNGVNPNEIIVGLDGIAVVVNPANPVNELTIDQLSDIFTGKVTDWKEVGGKPGAIVALSREVNSGTYIYFKEKVLGKGKSGAKDEFAPATLMLSSSQAIADEITGNPDAIGYYGMGYINPHQKVLKVAKTAGDPYYIPDNANVVSGKYPVSRPLFVYTNGIPGGHVKTFIDFVLSPQGQDIVKLMDFVPLVVAGNQ